MEDRLQDRLQISPDHLLGAAIGDRWNPKRSFANTPGLRDHHPSHRRRKVAPRGQPVPQLVEVVREINLEVRDRLPIYSSRSLVGPHLLEGFPDFSLRYIERLCLSSKLLPLPVGSEPRLNNAAPLVQPHYRTFIPTTSRSAPVLRIGTLILADLAA